MALIPSDAGVRMRLPSDVALQPVTPITDIPADLPDLQAGQVFTARIQDVLPENTYRALVAGKHLTLALPEGAESGDVLELIVVDRTAQTVIARPAPNNSDAGAYQHTTLSPAAQLIGQLLSEEQDSGTVALNRGQPLLNAPPTTTAAPLAAALQNAVENSGMFYEAHQAQWVAGNRPVETLLQEPQGQQTQALPARGDAAATAPQTKTATADLPLPARTGNDSGIGSNINTDDAVRSANTATNTAQIPTAHTGTQTLPDELRPLVHQQLEAAASQRLILHGEAWPNQHIDWQVERDKQHTARSAEEPQPWLTTLRLTTPRLGSVEAQLRISGNNLQLNLRTPVGASAADMRDELPALTDALTAAGINLQAAQVRHEPE